MQRTVWFDRGWLILWGIISSVWCLTAAERLSATFDEPHYLKHGLHAWRSGSYFMLLRGGTMPLPMDVQMLPVFVWELVRGEPINLDAQFGAVLQVARAMNLLFWWLLLYFSWRLANRFGGPWAGRLAIPFLACDPNFLAHASLATADIAVSACLAMFLEIYLANRDQPWRRRVGLAAAFYGIAILAKVSALVFGIFAMLAFEAYRLWNERQTREHSVGWLRWLWRETHRFRWDSVQIVALGVALTFVYCGSDWRPDRGGVVKSAESLPPGEMRDRLVWLANQLCIFPNAGQGILYQFQHNMRGHGAFIIGEWHKAAVWYYFPLALTMKLSIPILLLLAGSLLLRPKSYVSGLGILAAVMLLFTLNCRVQIGIRLILPVLTVLFVCLAVSLAKSLSEQWRWRALTAVCLLLLVPMWSIWPHGLCYFNYLWGGPDSGYRYLSDSNYDWGQGIDDLRRWQAENARPAVKVWYYGIDPRLLRGPDSVPLHGMPIETEQQLRTLLGDHCLAVGITLLYSNPELTPSTAKMLKILKQKQPIARTMTFFIYDFSEPTHLVANP